MAATRKMSTYHEQGVEGHEEELDAPQANPKILRHDDEGKRSWFDLHLDLDYD